MVAIDQSQLAGKTRDRPISSELETLLQNAGVAAGIDTIFVVSGGQPGTKGTRHGSTRHDGGRAADLYLVSDGKTLSFTDSNAPAKVKKFITACAALGASGIGAGIEYMGKSVIHIGFGVDTNDKRKIVWGAKGRSVNAPQWLRDCTREGWVAPPDWVFSLDQDGPEDLPEEEDHIIDSGADFAEPITNIPPRFTEAVIRGAQASQRTWGIPASITLAQWALESAYGSRMPAGSNNPFGIKARPGEASVAAMTNEVLGGQEVRLSQNFRVFPDMETAFVRHGRLLAVAGTYAAARQYLHDPDKFADQLTGVYATDPKYGSSLKKIMRKNDLYRFDLDSASSGNLAGIHSDEVLIADMQQKLAALGFNPGGIDGKFGPLTEAALSAFQRDRGIPETGVFDYKTLDALGARGITFSKPNVEEADDESTIVVLLKNLMDLLETKNGGTSMSSQNNTQAEMIRKILLKLAEAAAEEKDTTSSVSNWLGKPLGRLLNGRKTGLGIIGLLGSVLLPGLFPTVFGPLVELFSLAGNAASAAAGGGAGGAASGAVEGQTVLQWLFGSVLAWGVADKVEKSGNRKKG